MPALAAPPLDLTPAAGVYERRGVGLLAVDVRDSTLLHQSVGNRKAHAWTAAALDLAESAARSFDGAVVRRMCDGYLMLFPDSERAMRAAAAIQESLPAWRERAGAPGIELRAAVHAGRVLVDASGKSPAAYGQSVERAIALADKSLGGEVAMDAAMAEHLLARGWGGRAEHYRAEGVSLLRLRADPAAAAPAPQPAAPVEVVRVATLFTSRVTMEITVTRRDPALVVGVRGRLDSTTSSQLEQELLSRIATAERCIVLDCSQLAYISSAGLRAVLVAAKKLKNLDGTLVLCSLNESVWKVFDLAGFTRILSIRPTLQDALTGLPAR